MAVGDSDKKWGYGERRRWWMGELNHWGLLDKIASVEPKLFPDASKFHFLGSLSNEREFCRVDDSL
jgi:hypothetical protein